MSLKKKLDALTQPSIVTQPRPVRISGLEAPELASVRAKIGRAERHLCDIDAALKLLISSDPNAKQPVTFDYESDGKEIVVKLASCEPLDPALPLMIGDCLHNLRSALDHLVYRLALKHGASTKSADKTFFPIYLTKDKFDARVEKLIKPFISSIALAEIEKCQPYSAYDVPEEADVWILSQLDIFDKHRLLVVAGQTFAATEFALALPTGEELRQVIPKPIWKPVEEGAEIIRFRFVEPPGRVRVQIKMVTTIQFINTGLSSDGIVVQDALRQCVGIVAAIASDFGKRFFGE
jgi:hypothetical protein